MDLEEFGLAVAAVASCINLWLQLKDRHDRYVVRLGRLTPPLEPSEDLYIVNRSKHPICFVDYGFVRENGSLYSIPDQAVNDLDPEYVFYLVADEVEPGKHTRAGTNFSVDCCAAYAISSTQWRPSLSFRHGTPWRIRLRIRWLAIWGGAPAMYAKAYE